ncbi:MAG TPA: penicillin acylase family protein [Mycobacteriales bacterium]|nr:penicillin acylase family protein [Mycobacteriales bacterium]
MRRPLLAASALLASAALVLPGSAAPDLLSYTAHGEVLNILPPGSRGNVGMQDLATLGLSTRGTQATPTSPASFADQLEMYDALGRLTPGRSFDLQRFYKDGRLGVADKDVVATENPKPGVVIKRDRYGVPHIWGSTDYDVAWGAGYANIEDRMFLTDVLRHTGAARMAEFLGPSPSNIASDAAQLRSAAYTPDEAETQLLKLAQRYGAEGADLLDQLDSMIRGMNKAQQDLCPLTGRAPVPGHVGIGLGEKCPVEYAALSKRPEPYTRADIVSIASLVGGIFGKGGGGELANARWLQQLQAKLGKAEGRRVYDDLREKNDPEAPVTSREATPYLGGRVDPDRPGVALPDLGGATASGTGAARVDGRAVRLPTTAVGVLDGPLGPIDLGLARHGMSNALLVDGRHSSDGHPTVVFGPQTGYFTPQLLVEQDLDGPNIKARGVSFAGTNLVVELGHGVDYAWSATSASSDNVDTVVERLCNTDGSRPSVSSTGYLVDGRCKPMAAYTHTETADPNVSNVDTGNPTASHLQPQTISFSVLRTRHGIVQLRTTVKGRPVAVVQRRSTYGHEVDSALGFHRLMKPSYVRGPKDFQRAASAIDYTFNWFYVDARHIAYYCSGLLPVRAPGYDPDLPHWGDTRYDDRGRVGFGEHPRAIDPAQGYLVSWNNKQAPSFSAADNHWGYGPVYRSLTLEDRIKARLRAGQRFTREQLVTAMEDAATVDVRGAYLLPLALDLVGTPADAQDRAATSLLRAWVRKGSHRVDRARTGAYADQAAVALMDAWWDPAGAQVAGTTAALPKEVMRGALGSLVDQLPQGLDDHPRQGLGSSWNDVAWYGYVSKELRRVLHRPERGAYSRSYCGTRAACRARLLASLHAAVQALLRAQGASSVSALTYDKHRDDIRSVTAGVVGVRPIDWQNRPTFQQVVHFRTHR